MRLTTNMRTTMMIKLLTFLTLCSAILYADSISDQDMDGVPDTQDKCLDTPFLTEVDSSGCSTKKLFFPQERHSGNLDILLGYGYRFDDDNIERKEQHTLKLQASYVLNNWIYTLRTGYITSRPNRSMTDTTFKVKRRFKPTEKFKFSLGAAVRFPTYDFTGNKTDFTLYSFAVYYPVSKFSIFAGAHYTFINDVPTTEPLQNITSLYIGSGYFFTKSLYLNASYSYSDTKFANYHKIKALSSTLFYQLNDQWFILCSYSHEIDDNHLHISRTLNVDRNSFNVSIGYRLW